MPYAVQIDDYRDTEMGRPYVLRVFDNEQAAKKFAEPYRKKGYACHIWCLAH